MGSLLQLTANLAAAGNRSADLQRESAMRACTLIIAFPGNQNLFICLHHICQTVKMRVLDMRSVCRHPLGTSATSDLRSDNASSPTLQHQESDEHHASSAASELKSENANIKKTTKSYPPDRCHTQSHSWALGNHIKHPLVTAPITPSTGQVTLFPGTTTAQLKLWHCALIHINHPECLSLLQRAQTPLRTMELSWIGRSSSSLQPIGENNLTAARAAGAAGATDALHAPLGEA